ncbi:MFS general substrate transporter [Hyaloraphidium curvatum]|nr:MFS general substrate transporter [Hyaloraphidium curvatum]
MSCVSARALPLGVGPLVALPASGRALFATRAVRLIGYGALGFFLAMYFAALGLDAAETGVILSLTLFGDAGFSLLVTRNADHRWGRRASLVVSSLLMALAGAIFARTAGLVVITLAATLGVVSPSGFEVGPAVALEQSVLSDLVARAHPGDDEGAKHDRTSLFGLYQFVGYCSAGAGAWAAGMGVAGLADRGFTHLDSLRAVMWGYSVTGLFLAGMFGLLSREVEFQPAESKPKEPEDGLPVEEDAEPGTAEDVQETLGQRVPGQTNSESNDAPFGKLARLTTRLCVLFALDSFAGSLGTGSLLALWFDDRFHLPMSSLGSLLSITQIIAGVSVLLAPLVARRFGLVRTMVFTHLPSNVLAAALPFARTSEQAAALLFARFSLSQMDTVPRASFQAQIAPAEHRTQMMGAFNIAKGLATALGPGLAGWLFQIGRPDMIWYLLGGLKIVYDLWLLVEFGTAG